MVKLYCLKCRAKTKCNNVYMSTGINPKTHQKYYLLKGSCSQCGTTCNQFTKKENLETIMFSMWDKMEPNHKEIRS